MNETWTDATDDEIAALLVDLGRDLEPGRDVTADVVRRIGAVPAERSGRVRPTSARWLVAAAAVAVALVSTVLAVAPAREAVARWLGIGAVEIRPGAVDGAAPPSSTVPAGTVDVAAIESEVPFDVALLDPALAGPPLGALVDREVPAGLVEIRYEEVTLVEIASAPGSGPALGKLVGDGTWVEPVAVEGRPGFWLSGDPHELAYLDPDGAVRSDTVRRAGNVLVWAEGAVTYRIEGAVSLDEAVALAASVR